MTSTLNDDFYGAAGDEASHDGTPPHVDVIDGGSDDALPYPPPSNPTAVARCILTELFTELLPNGKEIYTLRYWRGDWYTWQRTHWQLTPDDELTGKVWLHLDGKKCRKGDETQDWCPTGSKVADVRRALIYLVHLPDDADAPMWVDNTEDAGLMAKDIIGMDNHLLHLPTRQVYGFTPRLFNLYALPYAYDAKAECPMWLRFIESTFADDRAGALAVQEFFGYVLTGDKSRQKGFMLIGPPGGGKGVLSNTLTAMIGEGNVASTDPKTLSGEFGLMPLIGKPLALLSDARTDGPVGADVLGRLLRIIGNDPIDVNRKSRPFWTGFLPTRLVWISNDLPRFVDPSGAIIRRWLVVRLTKAVDEKDRDANLGEKLRAELPGILNWALQGLDALSANGRFTEPGTQAETLDELKDAASPVSAFLNDCYQVTGDMADIVPVTDVLTEFKVWAEKNGYRQRNRETLMGEIKSCPEKVTAKNTCPPGYPKKDRLVFGIRAGVKPW